MVRSSTLFISYSEEDSVFVEELEKHLALLQRRGLVRIWHKRKVVPGQDWRRAIDDHVQSASMILLIVSADFLASDYCSDGEVSQALVRQNAGQAIVIPILARPADWHAAPFGCLQPLPGNGTPVSCWEDRDAAWVSIARDIRQHLEEMFSPEKYGISQIGSAPSRKLSLYKANPHCEVQSFHVGVVAKSPRAGFAGHWITLIGLLLGTIVVSAGLANLRREPEPPQIIFVPSELLGSGHDATRMGQIHFEAPEQFAVKIQAVGSEKVRYEVSANRDDQTKELLRMVLALLKQNNELIAATKYSQSQAKLWRRESRPQSRFMAQLDERIKAAPALNVQHEIDPGSAAVDAKRFDAAESSELPVQRPAPMLNTASSSLEPAAPVARQPSYPMSNVLSTAESLTLDGSCNEAIVLIRSSRDYPANPHSWRLIGCAACCTKNVKLVNEAYRKLAEFKKLGTQFQHMIALYCPEYGLQLTGGFFSLPSSQPENSLTR